MSFFDYEFHKRIGGGDVPFPALIMAAMRRASPENKQRLQAAFPEIWIEWQARNVAPAGTLTAEELCWVYRRIDAQREADLKAGKVDGFYPASAALFDLADGMQEETLEVTKEG